MEHPRASGGQTTTTGGRVGTRSQATIGDLDDNLLFLVFVLLPGPALALSRAVPPAYIIFIILFLNLVKIFHDLMVMITGVPYLEDRH